MTKLFPDIRSRLEQAESLFEQYKQLKEAPIRHFDVYARAMNRELESITDKYEQDIARLLEAVDVAEKALARFSSLSEAVHPTGAYHEDVIIQCEVTAGDIYEMESARAKLQSLSDKWKAE